MCFANIPNVRDRPYADFASAGQTQTASVRMTFVPIAIDDANGLTLVAATVCPVGRNASPARRASTANNPVFGGARPALLCMPVRSEGDPECKVGQDMGDADLPARIASTQAAGRTKLGDTETRRRGHRSTRPVTAFGRCIQTCRGNSQEMCARSVTVSSTVLAGNARPCVLRR